NATLPGFAEQTAIPLDGSEARRGLPGNDSPQVSCRALIRSLTKRRERRNLGCKSVTNGRVSPQLRQVGWTGPIPNRGPFAKILRNADFVLGFRRKCESTPAIDSWPSAGRSRLISAVR